MTTRYDVSQVPPQGGYIAKRCPVVAQNDVLQPCEPLEPSAFARSLMDGGISFEAEIFDELRVLHPRVVEVAGGDSADKERATSEAMAAGAPLILSGRLPEDIEGRRVGKPDLLVAVGSGGYRAVDVKHHLTLDEGPGDEGFPARCAELDALGLEAARTHDNLAARKRKDDLLQLAHYQRMLEAAGLEAPDGRFGGIVGKERRVVWYDLDAPIWRTPSSGGKQKLRSTMEVYDFEFDFRLDIMAVAEEHRLDPGTDLLVAPVLCGDCGGCPWWNHCGPQLRAGAGDVSLVPGIGWRQWSAHRDHGVGDRAELAALDVRTAELVVAKVDLLGALEATSGLDPHTPLGDVAGLGRRTAQLGKLAAGGIHVVGDLDALHVSTAAYSGAGVTGLVKQIDEARAALGPESAYRRRGVPQIHVPRADVEVDVDMENEGDGTYLWGALHTDRAEAAGGAPGRYEAFATWEPLDPETELEPFLRFWTWLAGVREAAAGAGRTFRAYCYSAGAENTELLRIGTAAGIREEVEDFIASEEWVDLLRVMQSQVVTGAGMGLKLTAPLAGYEWPVDDPGGAMSIVYHALAVGAETDAERQEARSWLLDYNRGDVEATFALREWLSAKAETIPPIESTDR